MSHHAVLPETVFHRAEKILIRLLARMCLTPAKPARFILGCAPYSKFRIQPQSTMSDPDLIAFANSSRPQRYPLHAAFFSDPQH
jgi:hypothetical protein